MAALSQLHSVLNQARTHLGIECSGSESVQLRSGQLGPGSKLPRNPDLTWLGAPANTYANT